MRVLLAGVGAGLAVLRDAYDGSYGGDWAEDDAALARSLLQIAGGIADQLFFASGVFHPPRH